MTFPSSGVMFTMIYMQLATMF